MRSRLARTFHTKSMIFPLVCFCCLRYSNQKQKTRTRSTENFPVSRCQRQMKNAKAPFRRRFVCCSRLFSFLQRLEKSEPLLWVTCTIKACAKATIDFFLFLFCTACFFLFAFTRGCSTSECLECERYSSVRLFGELSAI